ncbi:MAG: hypothetical protein KME11_16285 [Timaviella obliquedivisa GSE-PSE-MK23-08B]|jgi:hypothetical protein|nr:hypothetical protein [Timaviella obliquedivisa GSE-PSE-MK23-08B]
MKPRNTNYLWVKAVLSTAIASALTACTLPFFESLNPPSSPTQSPSASLLPSGAASAANPGSEPFQPESRVIPLSIEGQPVEVQLKLFDLAALPFTTYVPEKDFQSNVSKLEGELKGGSVEGQGIQFYYSPTGRKDENAYVQMFLPSSLNSVEDIRQLILGDKGIMANNQWELVDRTDVISYSWAKEKLTYQQPSQGTAAEMAIGAIYIGEDKGKAFYVLTHYPAEYADGFEPRSAVILENLQFRE